VSGEQEQAFKALMDQSSANCLLRGSVTGTELIVDGESFGSIKETREKYDTALGNLME
jgi:hypothetical protein